MFKNSYFVLIFIVTIGFGQSERIGYNPQENTNPEFFQLKSALEQALQSASPETIAQRHHQLGNFYQKAELYPQAMGQYNQAIEMLGTAISDTISVALNNSIGKVYLTLNNFEKAKYYFSKALKITKALKYIRGQAFSMGYLGSCYEKKGEFTKALEYENESRKLFEELGDGLGVAMVNENIGSIYEDLENYDSALTYFKKAFNHIRGTKGVAEANVLNNLGDSFRKKGNYLDAIAYTGMALEVAESLNDNHQLESAHKDLSKTYALMKDFEKAHHHLVQSEHYNSKRLKLQNTNQLNTLQVIYESNRKEAEIQLLKEQNKVGKANQNVLWVALFAIAAILTILYGYMGRKRKETLKIEGYKQRMLKVELEQRALEEKTLQREIQLKTAALSRYSLHLSQKNKILLDLSSSLRKIMSRRHMDVKSKMETLAKEIDFNLQQEREWDEFTSFFSEIHPEFIKKLSHNCNNSLSSAELRLGMLLRLNLTSKEIASILRVTPDSVRVARHRLRKKLPIGQSEELVSFMIDL